MAGNEVSSSEETPNTKVKNQKSKLQQSQKENETLRKQLEELQSLSSNASSKTKAKSPKKKRRRVFVLSSSSGSETNADSADSSDTDVTEETARKKKKVKRSRTIISRSTNSVETPTMKTGMKYADWVHWVHVWQHSIQIPKKEQAMLLLQALPLHTERFGNLQKLVADNLGIEENIKCRKGMENIIQELDKLYKEEEFPALVTFMKKWEQITQKPGQIEVYFQQIKSLTKDAKDTFGLVIPPMMVAAKIMIGCTELSPENFAAIAASIDFSVNAKGAKDSDPLKNIDVKVENEIRKFIKNMGSLSQVNSKNKPKTVHLADVDCLGNRTDNTESRRASAILSDEDPVSSMDEEQIEVFINKLQNKKNEIRKKKSAWKIPRKSPTQGQSRTDRSKQSPSKQRKVLTSAEKDFLKAKRERKLRLMREGKCIQCESEEHVIADCTQYKKIQEENKKRIEAQGKKWYSWEERKAMRQRKFNTKQVQLTSRSKPYEDNGRQTSRSNTSHSSRAFTYANSQSVDSSRNKLNIRSNSRSRSQSPSPRYSRFDNFETEKLYSVHNGVIENYLCLSMPQTEDLNSKRSLIAQSQGLTYNVNLVASSPDRAVADSGCEQAVSGVKWMTKYYEHLSDQDKDDVQIHPSSSSFKFGPGPLFMSQGVVVMPAYIAGYRKEIAFDIVSADVPLLLSLQNLKALDLTIQYSKTGTDTATHKGVKFELELAQGHHWIALSKSGSKKAIISKPAHYDDQLHDNESEILAVIRSVDSNSKSLFLTKSSVFSTDDKLCLQELRKVHQIQGHMSRSRLEANLKRANEWNPRFKNLLDTLYKTCTNVSCRSTPHDRRGPVAAFQQANKFGDIVAADLKIRSNGKSILYLVDYATSYALATFIDTKTCREITEKIIMLWYGNGLPRIGMLLTDNGLEFNGIQLNEFLSRFNTVKRNTSPYHPEMNGKCERIHSLVDLNMSKILNDNTVTDINDNIALSFAVTAYNLSDMSSGYSPVQLVFGPQDSLTSIVNQSLNQAESWDPNLRYAQLLKVRQEAVLNHLQIVTKSKFRNMILRKATPTAEPKTIGQWVYIKRNGQYEGPGQVCSSLNSKCQVVIGSSYLNASFSDLIPLTQEEIDAIPAISKRIDPLTDTIDRIISPPAPVTTITTDTVNETVTEHASTNTLTNEIPSPLPNNERVPIDNFTDNVNTGGNNSINSSNTESHALDATNRFAKGDMLQIRSDSGWKTIQIQSKYRHNYARNRSKYRFRYTANPNSAITYEDFNEIPWRTLPPSTEANSNTENVMDNASSIYLTGTDIGHHCQLAAGEIHTVFATTVPYHLHGRPDCVQAKIEELQSIQRFGTFEDVDRNDLTDEQRERIIPSSWVIVEKGTPGNIRTKARLVARGDKELDADMIRSDSPTGSKTGLRLLLSICASKGWKCKSIDFKNAFLQGTPLDREVFMLPPKDYREKHPDTVWKIIKPLYGLKDASRRWNSKIDIDFKNLNLVQSNLDQALYYMRDPNNELMGMLLIHVDDCIFCGIDTFHKTVIRPITKKYEISSEDVGEFTFTGWNLQQSEAGITISQSDYLNSVDFDKFNDLRNPVGNNTDTLSHELQVIFRRAVGTLGWLTHISKPHLAYYSAHFATKVMKATVADSKLMYRTLHKAKTDNAIVNIANLGPIDQWKIISFSDSSWSRSKEFESIHGNITAVYGSNSYCNLIDWQAVKSDPPSSSAMAAEADGCVLALGKIQMIQYMMREVLNLQEIPANMYNDSKSLNDCVDSTSVIKDKRMYINVAGLRSMKSKNSVKLKWLEGESMHADALTKHSASKEHLLKLMTESKLVFTPEF